MGTEGKNTDNKAERRGIERVKERKGKLHAS